MFIQPRISHAVGVIVQVLSAVDLDNQPRVEAHEIDDIRSDGLLSFKFGAAEAMGAQVFP